MGGLEDKSNAPPTLEKHSAIAIGMKKKAVELSRQPEGGQYFKLSALSIF
jgi:hypothetical protein